jgi:hypothetical protein
VYSPQLKSFIITRIILVPVVAFVITCLAPVVKGEGPVDYTRLIQDGESIDPDEFIEAVTNRYRSLRRYVEETDVHQETFDDASSEKLIDLRTRVRAEILNGRLEVERPGLGDDVVRMVLEDDSEASAADLLLLPHMQFYFADEPLSALRRGIEGGFEAWNTEVLRSEGKTMVRVQLRSIETDPEAESKSIFDFLVDPVAMLVERIEGRHSLGKGLTQVITIDIDPLHAFFDIPKSEVNLESKGAVTADENAQAISAKGS